MTTPLPEPASISRRRFLGGVAAGAGAGWLATLAGCVNVGRRARTVATEIPAGAAGEPGAEGAAAGRVLSPAEWRTLEAALDVLLPSAPGSAGARDCNGIGYLDAALADRDTDPLDVALVRAGATWLDEAARGARALDFASAAPEARDAAMRAVGARPSGPEWMMAMLSFGLESMLGDPVHGGNPGEVGWKWLGYEPGQPRPSSKAVELPRRAGPR